MPAPQSFGAVFRDYAAMMRANGNGTWTKEME